MDNTYCCDGCATIINFDEVNWFTSGIGFCDSCDKTLHKEVPRAVYDFCYDEIEAGSDEVCEFICKIAKRGV